MFCALLPDLRRFLIALFLSSSMVLLLPACVAADSAPPRLSDTPPGALTPPPPSPDQPPYPEMPGQPPPDASHPAPPPDSAMPPPIRNHQDLLERIERHGRLPVIVRLRIPEPPPGAFPQDSETAQQTLIADTQRQVIERLLRTTGTTRETLAIKTFALTPAIALQADALTLTELLSYPEVLEVMEDSVGSPLGH